jgi:hypothetical protein
MTKLNKILAAALGAQLLLVAVVFTSRDAQPIAELAPVLGAFDEGAITKIELGGADQDGDGVVLTRTDEGFVVESAHGYPADQARVDELLGALEGMQTREPLATSEGRARQLEVADDAHDRKLVLHREGGEPLTLYLGAPAGRGRIAARLGGEAGIHAVQTAVGRAARTRQSEWLEQPFFEVERDQLASLAVENAQLRAVLVRDDEGAWTLDEDVSTVSPPPGQILDVAAADTIARLISRLRIAEVAAAEPSSEHGFDEPLAVVELVMAPEDGGEGDEMSVAEARFVLVIGAGDEDHVFLRVVDRPFVVSLRRSAIREVLEADRESLFASQDELDRADEDVAADELPLELPGFGAPGQGELPPLP